MNQFEQYLVELLQGHITCNEEIVEVRKTFLPHAELPVITLDLGGGVTTIYSYLDVSGPTEKLWYRRKSNITINVWCNTESERETINNQILDCFYRERVNHYMYCTQYQDGRCSYGGNCKVSTIHNSRTAKNKCPHPERYGYHSISEKYYIVPGEIIVEPPFDMDEEQEHPPILRSVFSCNALFEEPVVEHGVSVDEINNGDIHVLQ